MLTDTCDISTLCLSSCFGVRVRQRDRLDAEQVFYRFSLYPSPAFGPVGDCDLVVRLRDRQDTQLFSLSQGLNNKPKQVLKWISKNTQPSSEPNIKTCPGSVKSIQFVLLEK